MSEIDVSYGEASHFSEKSTLVSTNEVKKHASHNEKDDANLLSEGSSQEDEGDLVLEYTDGHEVSGELQDTVVYADGSSTSASETEITGLAEDQLPYQDSGSVVAAPESENQINSNQSTAVVNSAACSKEPVLKDEQMSRIVEVLSSTQISKDKEEVKEKIAVVPDKVVYDAECKETDLSEGIHEFGERRASFSSLSDTGNVMPDRQVGFVSSGQSGDEDLEWEEEYPTKKNIPANNPPFKLSAIDKNHVKKSEEAISEKEMEAYSVKVENLVENGDHSVKSEVRTKKMLKKTTHTESEQVGSVKYTEHERVQPGNLQQMPIKVNNQTVNVQAHKSKPKKKKKKARHKVYLDDPDIHQCIADYAHVLQRFTSEIETGKFVPKAQNRLHPVSRDDVFEVKPKRRGNKKRFTAPSTLRAMDQQSDDGMEPIQQTRSADHLGPYDGHGKRGRNLIARIREISESSSSADDDEITDSKISTFSKRNSKRSSSSKSGYEICEECGEQHSLDEETNEESEQEICPDCGVPHNPFQHPPSPSAKDPQDSSKGEDLPSVEGPHTKEELSVGARYKMKYLGTTQVTTQHPVTKEARMQQAKEAFCRIKAPEDEVQPCTETEMIITLERLKVVNCEGKHEDVMMDHALRTVCFICDMGNILVLMSRRLTTDLPDLEIDAGSSESLSKIIAEREKRTSKNICHIFECEEAQKISKAIGQAFNMAYRQFLRSNGISHDNVEEAEYGHVLESQKIVGQDLDLLTDKNNSRDVVIQKKRNETLGIMLLESGWGSMLPTVFLAHIANYSPVARLGGQLSVGDHLLACNGASLVGLPLSECNQLLRNTRSSARVILKIVSCPPVVDVVVSRPDTKYQLGFSVQNGTICSLLRGGIAERGGVRVGHRIIEINGESVVAKTHQHIVDILANTSGAISMKTLPVAMYRLMVGIDTPAHV